MSIFQGNITFAVINATSGWRSAMAEASAVYYAAELGGSVVHATSIDEALNACTTKHLFILSPGFAVISPRFFEKLEGNVNNNMFLGTLILEDDYCTISPGCIYFNTILWDKGGKPAYVSERFQAQDITAAPGYENVHNPGVIVPVERFNSVSEYVASHGGKIIDAQIRKHGWASAMLVDETDAYYFMAESPAQQVLSETRFMSAIYPKIQRTVELYTKRQVPNSPAANPDVLIIPADGLYTSQMAKLFRAKTTIIWSPSQEKLELQRLIFGIEKATNLENLATMFSIHWPKANVVGDKKLGRGEIIHSEQRSQVKYLKIDPVGHELFTLIDELDTRASAIIDVHDTFVNPLNHFRLPHEGLKELYQHLRIVLASRIQPARILGRNPDMQMLDEQLGRKNDV